ncbi:MAG TPA: hypothetical protein VIU46_09625, partial [Gallionellaceae bacterium]
MGKVEAQPLGTDQRALLLHVVAEHGAQRGMQQMGGGMIGAGGAAAFFVHLEVDGITGRKGAFGDAYAVNMQRAQL